MKTARPRSRPRGETCVSSQSMSVPAAVVEEVAGAGVAVGHDQGQVGIRSGEWRQSAAEPGSKRPFEVLDPAIVRSQECLAVLKAEAASLPGELREPGQGPPEPTPSGGRARRLAHRPIADQADGAPALQGDHRGGGAQSRRRPSVAAEPFQRPAFGLQGARGRLDLDRHLAPRRGFDAEEDPVPRPPTGSAELSDRGAVVQLNVHSPDLRPSVAAMAAVATIAQVARDRCRHG